MPIITFTTTDPETEEEVVHELPAKWVVCHDCRGEGRTLNENLRGVFTHEEFMECFDDEDSRMEYMKGGSGIYGVPCKTCNERTTVAEVDWKTLRARDPKLAKAYEEHLREEREYQRLCEMERRMGA